MSEAASAWRTETTIELSDAQRYMKQLCRHFGHKVDVTFDDVAGIKRMPGMRCTMTAVEPTRLHVEIDAESAERAERQQGVIERHLVKFAFREELTFDWSAPTQLATTAPLP